MDNTRILALFVLAVGLAGFMHPMASYARMASHEAMHCHYDHAIQASPEPCEITLQSAQDGNTAHPANHTADVEHWYADVVAFLAYAGVQAPALVVAMVGL